MPIYEFCCTSCGKTTEKLSSMSETSTPCPDCGADCRKAISIPSPGQVSSGPAASGPPPCAATCGKTSGFG
jgi:putative FmdB family regulatory protein